MATAYDNGRNDGRKYSRAHTADERAAQAQWAHEKARQFAYAATFYTPEHDQTVNGLRYYRGYCCGLRG